MQKRLFHFPLALVLFGVSAPAEDAVRCRIQGAIFGVDPIGGTILLKDSSGYLKSVTLSPGMTVSKTPVTAGGSATTIRVADLNTGDLLCVHGEEKSPQLAVVLRGDLHRAQSDFLVAWQRDSLYGTLVSVDATKRQMVVKPLTPSTETTPVRVTLPPSVRLRTAPPGARRVADSTSFAIEDLKPGDPVYVRGTRGANSSEMAAATVLKGGYRGIVGTLVKVQVSPSMLEIREFGTGQTLSMKVTAGQTYRTTENITHPMRVETASGVLLAPVGLADLSVGDAILIIGKAEPGASEGDGLVAVTKFGTFGVAPHDPEGHVSWLMTK